MKIRITNWLRGFFRDDFTQVNISEYRADPGDTQVAVEAFALFSVVELIAALLSKCEFKTYKDGKPFHGEEWYALNVRPNLNQNATEFWQELFCKLLYEQEALVVEANGQKIIADTFQKQEFALKESVFSQVSRGEFTFNRVFVASDVVYLKYTNANVQQAISGIYQTIGTALKNSADNHSRSGGERGTLEISAGAKGEQGFEEKFRDMMENRFKSYFKAKNAVMPLMGGMKYVSQSTAKGNGKEVADMKQLLDEAIARAAQVYKIPPAIVRGEVAGLKDAFDIMLTTCIDPLANMASEEFTGKKFTREQVKHGDYIDADTTCIKHLDIFSQASNIDKLIACGFLSPDETRARACIEETGESWAKKHYMTKNYDEAGKAADQKGGEENE